MLKIKQLMMKMKKEQFLLLYKHLNFKRGKKYKNKTEHTQSTIFECTKFMCTFKKNKPFEKDFIKYTVKTN